MKRKLNYRFHNPNSADVTAEFLCKLLVEVNSGKVERVIAEAARGDNEDSEYIEKNTSDKKEQIKEV